MTPATHAQPGAKMPPELIAASLLTSAEGAEVHLVSAEGQRFRLPADEDTARSLVLTLWRALDRLS